MYVLEGSACRQHKCDVATAEREKKWKRKQNRTGKENTAYGSYLIKMAERRGATYYGSWIEDERQYVAGAHFCVCLNKPVELPERDGSYVKNHV